EAERLSITDHDKRTEIAKRTREKKSASNLSMVELRKLWKERINSDEVRSILASRTGQVTQTLQAGAAMDYAILDSYERASVVTEKELLKTALIQSVGNASVGEIHGELNRDNILTKTVDGQRYATTKEVQREELAILDYARDGKGKYRKLGGVKEPILDESLSAEQRAAA